MKSFSMREKARVIAYSPQLSRICFGSLAMTPEGLLSLRATKDDAAISASMDQSLKPLSNPRFVSGTAMQAAS